MRRVLVLALLLQADAWALSSEAQEFMQITRDLEPVQCEKRKLRRALALAEIEKQDTQALRRRFAELDRDPKTAALEKRLSQLQKRVLNGSDAEDLPAINRQRVEAFYRCD